MFKQKYQSQYKKSQRYISALIMFFMGVQLLEVPLVVNAAPLVFSQTGLAAQADSGTNTVAKNHWGIVAILVDKSLLDDKTNYPGMTASYADKLKAHTL